VIVHTDVEKPTVRPKSGSESSRRAVRPKPNPEITVVDVRQAIELAGKAPPIEERDEVDTSDIPETDFARPGAARGKYYSRFVEASGLAQLDPDVREAFPDDASVNRTLRRVFDAPLPDDVLESFER
jgi:hypothetical protein